MLQVISVSFDELSLPSSSSGSCEDAAVTLYDGATSKSASLGSFCQHTNATITSSGSAVFVVFESRVLDNDAGGFALRWSFVDERSGRSYSIGVVSVYSLTPY